MWPLAGVPTQVGLGPQFAPVGRRRGALGYDVAVVGRALVLFLLTIASCGGKQASYPRDAAPSALQPAAEAADLAMDVLQKRLAARLGEAVAAGGPATAVGVCHAEALAITRAVADEHAIELGRTSHRLRNADNAPRAWLRPFVQQAEGQPPTGEHVVDLGDRVGVVRPLFILGPCLQCHGPEVKPEVAAAISRDYPNDRATGFAEGELRGFMWAEAPKRR